MSRLRLAGAVLMTLTFVTALIAQKTKTTVEQTIKVQGQNLTQKQESTFSHAWTPVKQERGVWQIKQKVEGLQMAIDISGKGELTVTLGKADTKVELAQEQTTASETSDKSLLPTSGPGKK